MKKQMIKPIPFGERPGPEPYNASELVTIEDSRFLFCDNNIGNALFELRLTSDARMACPLIRHQIEGIDGSLDDLEGLAICESGNQQFIFALPSQSLKKRKKWQHRKRSKRGKVFPPRNGFLRIAADNSNRFVAEIIPDFRGWLIENAPELGKASRYLPDDGGLNLEALGWDPIDQTLQLGLRTPVLKRKPVILRVRLKQIDGPWDVSNFELRPAVALQIDCNGEQGIRSIEYDSSRNASLVVVGNSTSSSKAPFRLYVWDGNDRGEVTRISNIKFHKKMRVEGITRGTICGRGALVFVDDRGGYQILWDDPFIT
ncbi:MAG TPA: DUF3616 domain-containing protein [Blastocatellia bacterium]|nr:DUF3616 domain-containing protein [Blastocatellia bacterium]